MELSFGQIGFEDINWIYLIQTMSNGGLLWSWRWTFGFLSNRKCNIGI